MSWSDEDIYITIVSKILLSFSLRFSWIPKRMKLLIFRIDWFWLLRRWCEHQIQVHSWRWSVIRLAKELWDWKTCPTRYKLGKFNIIKEKSSDMNWSKYQTKILFGRENPSGLLSGQNCGRENLLVYWDGSDSAYKPTFDVPSPIIKYSSHEPIRLTCSCSQTSQLAYFLVWTSKNYQGIALCRFGISKLSLWYMLTSLSIVESALRMNLILIYDPCWRWLTTTFDELKTTSNI